MVSSIGSFSVGSSNYQSLRSSITTAAAKATEDLNAQRLKTTPGGANARDVERTIAQNGWHTFTEEELVANETEINGREALRVALRQGIADPDEEYKTKAALVFPLYWPEDQKIAAARGMKSEQLDSMVQTILASPRPMTTREMQQWSDQSGKNVIKLPPIPAELIKPPTPEMQAELAYRVAKYGLLSHKPDATQPSSPSDYRRKIELNVDAQVQNAAMSGASTKELERIIATAGRPVYSEDRLVANETEINGREALKTRLRDGITNPDEEFRAKVALVYPWFWPEDRKLEAARAISEGELNKQVQSMLKASRPSTLREMQQWSEQSEANVVKLPPISFGPGKPVDPVLLEKIAKRDSEYAQAMGNAHPQQIDSYAVFQSKSETNTVYESNVASMDMDAVTSKISNINDLIKSGVADTFSFEGYNGEKTTNSIHQFLQWLLQRANVLESDGTYSPKMFR